MWIVSGCFDGAEGVMTTSKSKLLRPSTSYPVGRKDSALLVRSKKVSKDHCEIKLGPFSLGDVRDPSKRPPIHVTNHTKKPMRIWKNGLDTDALNPGETKDVQDGDGLVLASDATISFFWRPLCVFSQTAPSASLEICRQLGAHFVLAHGRNVTHHLTNSLNATKLIATSLILGCRLVKSEWLTEYGNLNGEESTEVNIPSESKFRPSFSSLLAPAHKHLKTWEPKEARATIFEGYRFLCVGERSREIDSELRLLIESGGGAIETFNASDGPEKLRKALVRGSSKANKKLAAIADEKNLLAAIGETAWAELNVQLASFDRQFITAMSVIEAVITLNTSLLTPAADSQVAVKDIVTPIAEAQSAATSTLPSLVPNTIDDEPSAPPPSVLSPAVDEVAQPAKRQLKRRVASVEPTSQPVESPTSEEPAPAMPRRGLTRRVNAGVPILTGIDDTSAVIDAAAVAAAAAKDPPQPKPPSTVRSSKLKRRVGASVEDDVTKSTLALVGVTANSQSVPAHEKFRGLFESTDPERIQNGSSLSDLPEIEEESIHSIPESETQSGAGGPTQRRLRALREEEEETQSLPRTAASGSGSKRGLKRRAGTNTEDDVEMAGVADALVPSSTTPGQEPSRKRRAVEGENEVERSKENTPGEAVSPNEESGAPPKKKPGVATGQAPDTDEAFLKAIASSKKGKKKEDDFDREFNKLKIAKPEVQAPEAPEPEAEWAIVEDFGDQNGLRGNFMVVLEMDLHKRPGSRRRDAAVNPMWGDMPNFKKFKKTKVAKRTEKVTLVLVEQEDYGATTSYLKRTESGGPKKEEFDDTVSVSKVEIPYIEIDDSGDDASVAEEAPPPPPAPARGKSRAGSRATSRAPSVQPAAAQRTTTRAKLKTTRAKGKSSQPLFLSDGSDEDAGDVKLGDDLPLTLDDDIILEEPETLETFPASPAPTLRPSKKRKAAPIAVDSDDEGAFKGFGGAGKRTRTRR